jgi:hypothetical protein
MNGFVVSGIVSTGAVEKAYEATVKVLTIKLNLGFDYEYMSAYIPEDTKECID